MCEALRGKKVELYESPIASKGNKGEWLEIKDVKSAVKFYKKYRYNPHWLKMKYPKVWENIPEKAIYIDWLFDYCFGDVIE